MDTNGKVKKIGFNQFLTGQFVSRAQYLSNEEYALMLDNVVIAYVNYVLVSQDKKLTKMLLVKRNMEPWPDWWLPGGRMSPGKSYEETAIEHMKRQLSLSIDERSRFQYLGTYSFVWEKRGHAPTENGCHIVSAVLVLKVDNKEAKAIIRLNEEYSEFSWTRPEIVVIQAGLHPGLAQQIRDLIEFLGITKTV